MAHTLGITGMDSATEDALRSAFEQATTRLGKAWELAPESSAGYVVVDMDSMYGPMSWIRLHAAGKQVIGLTGGSRTQADYLLARPVDADALAALLTSISGQAPAAEAPPAAQASPEAPPSVSTPAPAPADELPEERATPSRDPEAAAPPEPAAALEPAPAADAPPAPPAPPAAPRERTLADWLAPGALPGRWKLQRGGVSVLVDADARTYHGPAALKPLAAAFDGTVERDDFEPIAADAWAGVATGAPQPLVRLQWLGALLAGKGALLPGYDPAGQYRLVKWPQTEREYPRHFRIATAMMKGPATLAETAAASGVPLEEVADFVNANLATGFAEPVLAAPAEAAEPPKPGGLLGRLRTR
jgi:hypothetical protein